jgi:hypothetical protein
MSHSIPAIHRISIHRRRRAEFSHHRADDEHGGLACVGQAGSKGAAQVALVTSEARRAAPSLKNRRGDHALPELPRALHRGLRWLGAVFVYLVLERIINRMLAADLAAGQCFLMPRHFLAALFLTLIEDVPVPANPFAFAFPFGRGCGPCATAPLNAEPPSPVADLRQQWPKVNGSASKVP